MKLVYDKVHPDLFASLTKEQQVILYIIRGSLVRTRSQQQMPGWILEFCDDYIRSRMQEATMEIIPGGVALSFWEYSSYFLPLEVWGGEMKEQFAGKDWYTELLNGKEERIHKFDVRMNVCAYLLMRHISSYRYTTYHVDYKIYHDSRANGVPRLNQEFALKAYNPREVCITFSDKRKKSRNALEAVYNGHKIFGEDEFEPLTPFFILPSKLGISVEGEEKPFPVFILRHALKRLEERLGCLVTGYVEAQIVPSLLKGEVCKLPDGGLLVAYYLEKSKAGYLYIDVDDGVILVRTFLFLTNASTPEGRKLRKHIGLQKDDVKFLNIDRLTPLMESDLLQDEELCDLFRNAGCEPLIELCEKLKDSEYWNHTEEKKQLAEKLKKYMQLGM